MAKPMPKNINIFPVLEDGGGETKLLIEGAEEILLIGGGGGGGELETVTSGTGVRFSDGGGAASPDD